MITETENDAQPGVTKLIGGIIHDAQELFRDQLNLFRAEIEDDLRQTKEAGIAMAIGGLVLLLGGIFLGLMAVYLLSWLFPELPLWGSFGIVGGALAVMGVIFVYTGKKKFASFNPLPDKSVEALKETFNGRVRND